MASTTAGRSKTNKSLSAWRRLVPAGVALAAAAAWAAPAFAQTAAEKAGFTFANPTPDALLRALAPDRPDATESPFTVDAGRVQLEISFIDYSRDRDRSGSSWAYTVFDTNVKLGLTSDIDVQFLVSPYTNVRDKPPGGFAETIDGFGDLTVRVKFNLWGNDEQDPRTPHGFEAAALGLMPFIKIPTGTDLSNDHVEGGLIIPFAVALGDTAGLGLMAELDAVYDEADGGYDMDFVHTATIGFDVAGPLGAYIEYIGAIGTDSDLAYRASFSGGVTLEITKNLLLDAGIVVGLNDRADDLSFFTGATVRF